MNLKQYYLLNNDCFKAGKYITPRGIMVHSTGANNPYLKRYINPDNGELGQNQYNNHWNQPTKPGNTAKCVHAFIGKLANGSIATYQTLPWNMRGWHAGGDANNTHIGFEICEDDLTDQKYFEAVYNEAVELCVYLCRLYNFNPLTDIIDHAEGYKKGIASNHGDITHWFKKFGLSMNDFRRGVKNLLETPEIKTRYFEILSNEVMNLRATAPNGKIITPIPPGTIISGNEFLTAANGTIWLKTIYNNIPGWVAVLPESKGYTREVYPSDELSTLKIKYNALLKDLEALYAKYR